MNVLSLFDGMSCCRLALEGAGIVIGRYYASEIDKHAIMATQHNRPDTTQLGCVTGWRKWDIDWSSIDFIAAGSPCQGFSSLGRGKNFNDERSSLFFDFVDILVHAKTFNKNLKFMLENVVMKKEHSEFITQVLGVTPVLINSHDFGPCSRPRLYWKNFGNTPVGSNNDCFLGVVSTHIVRMSNSWHKWWQKNEEKQQSKSYSKICHSGDKGIAMTARQYASWNGNFIELEDGIYKPNRVGLALLVGATDSWFELVTQRQAEKMAGNGWCVRTVSEIFKDLIF